MVYTDPLAWSGQFSYCSLPLRLDSYRGCGFSCSYCFARLRGGNTPQSRIVSARQNALIRQFKTAANGSTSIIAQALRRRVPTHFGGMSDPFQPIERNHGTTLSFLRALTPRKYPILISTKGELAAEPLYLSELQANPHVAIQVSLVAYRIELRNQLSAALHHHRGCSK
jgi:DNA repair photolyase